MAVHGAVKAEISGDGLVVLVRDSALSKQLLCAQALRKLRISFCIKTVHTQKFAKSNPFFQNPHWTINVINTC
jgi:hypothetical protein